MKKVLLVGLATLLGVLALLGLVGCGGNDEQVIRDGLTAQLDLSNPEGEEYQSLIDGFDEDYADFGITSKALVDSWLDGYACELGTIVIDGESATVEASITIKQLGPIMNAWAEQTTALTEDVSITTEDEYSAKAGEILMQLLKDATLTTTTATVTCTLAEGKWSSPKIDEELYPALYGPE